MRMPTIERRRPSNRRIVLIALAAVLVVFLVSLRGIAGFYTDYLWFQELGYTEVWRGLLLAKALPTAVFTVVFFLLILGNLIIADRLQPRFRPAGPEEELVERYRQFIGPYAGRVRLGVAAFLAVVAASGLTSQWNSWLLFRNRVDFGGPGDAQFGADIGFYVFTLPFLRFVFEWTFAALVIVLLVTAVAHYLNGGIRVQGPFQRVTPQVKAHLSVLLGTMALLKAFGYWLQRFELNFSGRGVVEGASYTDVRAQLPALNMLIVISIAAAVLFFVNRWLKGWVLPIIAVGLWSFVSVVIGTIYPTIVQKASVEPNEQQKERKYIERNIAATRKGFGLEKVELKDFAYKEDLNAEKIRANDAVIDDIRLWDPDVLNDTYTQLQQIRPQYTFSDVDIDRYVIDGKLRQVVLAAREIDLEKLPSQTWQNRHLVYTHGYGLVVSPSNGVVFPEGTPELLVKDMPAQGTAMEITQPAIYYGENLPGYAFVRTKVKEFDYPREGASDATTTYAGNGGVKVDSLLRRTALFLRFGDIKVLISGQITSESRALYLRDIRDRVRKAAPFLKYDADPYPVVLNGRILWVIDAYTVSDRYPYSQSYSPGTGRLAGSSGLNARLNYVRNSVKATIDAYDGTLKFYVYDDPADPDPIVRAYRKAFPKLFTDRSQMPAGLVDHLRYPEDMFRVQSDRFSAYHVVDPVAFYQNARAWAVAQDPGSGVLQPTTSTQPVAPAAPGRPAVTPSRRERMDPYYLQMRLPGQAKEGFLILQPFVPVATGRSEPTNLTAFMVAKSDPDEYGRLEAYTMPGGGVVKGPEQVDSSMQSTPEFSRQRSLLEGKGSQFVQGSLLLVPIEQSLLWIRPLYVQATGATQQPLFRFVAAVYKDQAVFAESLPAALSQLFPDLGPPPPPTGTGDGPAPPPPADGEAALPTGVTGLLAQAGTAYNEAQAALKAGNLAEYQSAVDRMADLIRQAQSASGASTTTTTAPEAATTTTRQ
ncbi:MAG TPA: UPF0182 family protein [Acidimicrobiia bacterium]|nr:UPF0182 family protein [Acidimicrobiia bacterium]